MTDPRFAQSLLRVALRLLPPDRREWGEALQAELAQVPAGRQRRRWTLGGLRLVATEAGLVRRLSVAGLALVAGAAVLRFGWGSTPAGSPSNPALPIGRAHLIVTVGLMAVLPWIVSRFWGFGPVADGAAARVVRAVGYLAACALMPVVIDLSNYAGARFGSCAGCTGSDLAQWRSERVSNAVSGFVVLTALMVGYGIAVLWLTSKRAAPGRIPLLAGAGCGLGLALLVYGLEPFGGGWPATAGWVRTLSAVAQLFLLPGLPMLAGWLGARSAAAAGAHPDRALGQGVRAGLLTGLLGALLITVFTVPTMVAFPRDVPLKWANPDPQAAHGTDYELRMSVSDGAAKYLGVLFLGPVFGLMLGGAGAALIPEPGSSRPGTLEAKAMKSAVDGR
jgi:hypothetical protein